jgi:ribosome-associated protein
LNSTELSEIVVEAVKDMKGQSIRCINVERLTSSTHLKALADSVSKSVKDAGQEVVGMEGKLASEWVLVDMGGVVLHLMLAPVRALYNLEELWNFETKPAADADSENPAA